MMYYAIDPNGRVKTVANYPDEVAEFIDRVAKEGPTTWSAAGQQVRVPDGTPTGWKIERESLGE